MATTFGDANDTGLEVDSREETMALQSCTPSMLVAGELYLAHDGPMENKRLVQQLQQFLELLIIVVKPIAKDDRADDV